MSTKPNFSYREYLERSKKPLSSSKQLKNNKKKK